MPGLLPATVNGARSTGVWITIAALGFVSGLGPAQAYDINDRLSVGGVASGAVQCFKPEDDFSPDDQCRGAALIQPEIEFRPSDDGAFFAKLGFARGNGLNKVSPYVLAPWAGDLQDDVRNINTRSRDYLLTAWYRHSFTLGEDRSLAITGGIIDATDYLDDNAYSNDEFTQFMNEALVNGPHAFLPSYDYGGAVELDWGAISVRAVAMAVGGNDDGNSFEFLGGQIGYTIDTALGEGTYRLIVAGSSRDFLDSDGNDLERRAQIGLSFDQALGEYLGAFIRMGWQDDSAAVNYKAIYSGGISIFGSTWGRPGDNIGVAYGYLDGGVPDIRDTRVAEFYYRLAVNEIFSLTADAQYMEDNLAAGQSPRGYVLGLRATAEF